MILIGTLLLSTFSSKVGDSLSISHNWLIQIEVVLAGEEGDFVDREAILLFLIEA